MKNSTDTIFELEIIAQKTRAKIRINVQKCAKNIVKICKNEQKHNIKGRLLIERSWHGHKENVALLALSMTQIG